MMIEKRNSGGIYHTIHRYTKANNKYMKSYNNDIEPSYLMFWMQTICVDGKCFKKLMKKKVSKFDEEFINSYDEDSKKIYIFEVGVEYPKELHKLHINLPFLSERMKIRKCNKLVCNLYDKKEYIVHIRALKQALNYGLILKKVHRVIQFSQEAWLKPYIEMNTKLRTEDFFKLMINSVFGKILENVRKHRDIKLVTTDKRRNQLVLEPN